MDQLSAMATFVRAVETGSLSAAARSLPSSLTSVSRQISALEEHFGTRLLLRTTRQLALTDDGRILYERAKSILGEVKEIEAALSRDRHEPSGRIRVSCPILMGRLVIAPLLAEFLRRYPRLSVDLLLVDRAVDMVEEDIHLAIRVGRLRDSQLVARKFADLRMVVCASPTYLARRGVPRMPRDLADHDCLVFSDAPGSAEWRFAESTKADRKIRISGRLWMNSLDALAAAAKEGAGIVRVPSWQVDADIRAGSLRRILTDYEPPPTPLHLVFQPSRLASPKTRAFVDYLVEQWRAADPFGAHAVAAL
ncbi:LysR family transcriptional regulator [Bradyrhizobium neotropicale]|uniref:LysR family transcriptional regulator n=1 Tax=Bradyrhizobium neotropicale TaxID=1497615 RepID=UPI001AD76CE9|nr:LysR family transcriptional regulator [Bradyrhizobium neotropicale]MBO4222762.1 LysR family transcriptional regulator [Bradyrhizobium neotropicale]